MPNQLEKTFTFDVTLSNIPQGQSVSKLDLIVEYPLVMGGIGTQKTTLFLQTSIGPAGGSFKSTVKLTHPANVTYDCKITAYPVNAMNMPLASVTSSVTQITN